MKDTTQNRKQKWILAGIAAIFILFALLRQLPAITETDDFAYATEEVAHTETMADSEAAQDDGAAASAIIVHVAGSVQKPGVYTLQQGQRVEDALQAAGVDVEADIDALNRAAILTDGQKIVVPSKNDAQQIIAQTIDDGMISLNQANLQQLMTLPGIGEVKAQAILDYRAQYGSFSSIEEIKQVSGIGEVIYGQIESKIKI